MTRLSRGAVGFPGSSRAYPTGTWRDRRPVHLHLSAPCHAACPAGEDPQAYIALAQEGRIEDAWRVLTAVNPLPAVTGRVCHHPCEQSCNRSQLDEPIAIHAIERFLGDEAIRGAWPLPLPEQAPQAEHVAVVGAGPAGLSAAYHLRRHGYPVTLFERSREPGGLLRTAIPRYRLSRDVLDAEVSRLLAVGITYEAHRALGQDIHLDELRRDFAAVFLAPGCYEPRDWTVEGGATSNEPAGLDLIRECLNVGTIPAIGKRIVVHGGGNTAVDIARLLRWAGAKEVHVVTASGLPGEVDLPAEDRMSAFPREVDQAREEGVLIHPHHTLTRVIVRDGRVAAVELAAVRKLQGRDHASHRVAFEGTERVLDADMVVPAIGEVVAPTGLEAVLRGNSFISVDEHLQVAGALGIFAGGDVLGTRGTVSAAIGDGRRAAQAIDRYLRKAAKEARPVRNPVSVDRLNLTYFDHGNRRSGAISEAADRLPELEIEEPLSEADVAAEVGRCLSCGSCSACDNCWTFCPDTAVLKSPEVTIDRSHYVFDYEFCKGCGLCARECPTGFITMVDEATGKFD